MRFEQILIALAVFFAVIALGTTMYIGSGDTKGIANEYGVDTDSELFSNLTKDDYSTYTENIEQLKADNLEGGEDVDTEETESSIYKTALQQISRIGSIVTTPFKLITRIAKKTGLIPEYISWLWITIFSVLSVAFVIYMFLRFKPQD